MNGQAWNHEQVGPYTCAYLTPKSMETFTLNQAMRIMKSFENLLGTFVPSPTLGRFRVFQLIVASIEGLPKGDDAFVYKPSGIYTIPSSKPNKYTVWMTFKQYPNSGDSPTIHLGQFKDHGIEFDSKNFI